MKSRISERASSMASRRMLVLAILCSTLLGLRAQQAQPTLAQQLAGLQRLEEMQPDSIGPKYQQAVLLLSQVCMQPQDSLAQQRIDEARRVIGRIEALRPTRPADRSDLATLRGFLHTAVITTNPQQNGPRYYQQALDSFGEALRLNPQNALAQQLLAQFMEGMQAAGR